MCKFCETLFDNKKILTWDVRNSYAEDNSCEYFSNGPDHCDECIGKGGCEQTFRLKGVKNDDGNCSAYVSYIFNVGELIISDYSEQICINYCPVCGKRLSNKLTSDNEIIKCMGNKLSEL